MYCLTHEDWIDELPRKVGTGLLFHIALHLKGFSFRCVWMWYFRFQLNENNLQHTLHLNGFSLMGVSVSASIIRKCPSTGIKVSRLCVYTYDPSGCHYQKMLFHMSHLESFSLVCVWRWCLMLSLSRNTFPHISHLNNFTPLCIWTWQFRLHLYENTLEHILHVKALYIACLLQYEFVNVFFTDSTCRSVCSFLLLEELLLYIPSISFSDIPATLCWSRCSVVLPLYCWVVKMCWLWQNKQYYFTQLFILSTKLQIVYHIP